MGRGGDDFYEPSASCLLPSAFPGETGRIEACTDKVLAKKLKPSTYFWIA
ncbi:MAG: hypothetical protein F6K09_13925 [Merismopedia sp. SIO2A8]|nr:hypothetical protein [Symploca sp. SIO2B6]NET49783.1 hypothetical protein [Merismopedia sp. SIO2A8]